MFDITTQAVAQTATMHVKNAAGELLYADAERSLPVQIVFYGPGSKQFGVIESRQNARQLKRMQDNDGKFTAAGPEERIIESADDLASITVAFNNLSYPPAGDAQGSALFEALYRDQTLGFIVKQANKFLADWGNFKAVSNAA